MGVGNGGATTLNQSKKVFLLLFVHKKKRLSVLVPEMPHACEHHGDAGGVGGGDDFGVAD
jgi:hypothetical protein